MTARRSASAAHRMRAVPVLVIAAAIVLACTTVLAWPLLEHRIERWKAERAIAVADDAMQWDIVRTYLQHFHQHGPYRGASVYFDTKSPVLCSLDRPEPCEHFDIFSGAREDQLVDRTYTAVPLELQRRLDRMALARTYNPDPRLSNVQTLTDAEKGAFDRICRQAAPNESPILIRMTRAVVDNASGRALAMVRFRSCGGYDNTRQLVASFIRNGDSWNVAEGNVHSRGDGRW